MDEVEPTIAELTHSWNKLFGCRDVVSKHFMNKLGVTAHAPKAVDDPSPWEFKGFDVEGDQRKMAAKMFYAMRARAHSSGCGPPDWTIAG